MQRTIIYLYIFISTLPGKVLILPLIFHFQVLHSQSCLCAAHTSERRAGPEGDTIDIKKVKSSHHLRQVHMCVYLTSEGEISLIKKSKI